MELQQKTYPAPVLEVLPDSLETTVQNALTAMDTSGQTLQNLPMYYTAVNGRTYGIQVNLTATQGNI